MSDKPLHTGDIYDPRVHEPHGEFTRRPDPDRYDPRMDYDERPIAPAVKKKKRVFMWVFLAVQVLFIFWLIAGVSGAGDAVAESCSPDKLSEYFTKADCEAASQVGAGIGFAMVLVLWAIVDFLLAIVWLVVKLARR